MPIPKKKKTAKRMKPKKLAAPLLSSITFPPDYSLKETGTSQSILQDFLKCRQCYVLSLNLFRPIGAKNTTGFGSLNHDVLDHMYSWNLEWGTIPTDEMIGEWVDTFPQRFPEDMEGIAGKELEWALGVSYVLMTEYVRYFKDDFTKIKFQEIEAVRETRWRGFLLRRKTDGKFRIHGKKWLMEHKTKGYISEHNLLMQLSFDFQNQFYIHCEEIDFPDDPVEGVLYNVIRRPAHMQKQGESLPEFLERLRKEVKRDPEHFFKRYEIKYTAQDKIEFKKELHNILMEAYHCINGDLPIIKNTQACVGAWTCDFLPACASGKLSGYVQSKFWFPELHIGI